MADWPYNTAQWKKLRLIKLQADPLCESCVDAGRMAIANTVDHVTPISAGGHPFPSLDQLTSMCPSCHSAKTARGVEAGAVRTTRKVQPRRGCDAQGNPLDAAHPWSGKSLKADANETAGYLNPQLVPGFKRSG